MSINPPAGPVPLPAGPPYSGPRPVPGPRSCPPAAPGRRHLPRHRRRRRPGPGHRLMTWPRGRRPATPYTTTAVRAVTSTTLPRARLDAGGTRLRLRALHVMGHGSARIARALGVREMTIRALVRGDARTVSPALRDTIADLYDAWWDKRAPARTRFERGAATAARKRAIAGNWCAAAALDDDQLDIPGYRPRHGWKPAAGTGIAPDIGPPARRTGRTADDQRPPDHPWPDPRHRGRAGTPRLLPRRRPARRPRHRAHRRPGLHLRRHPGPSRRRLPRSRSPPPQPDPPRTQQRPDAVTLTHADVSTVLAALDIAADYKRDRAETCARLPGPVLLRLPAPPPGRPRLRPDGRPAAARRAKPPAAAQPARPGRIAPRHPARSRKWRPASDRPPPHAGQTRNGRQAAAPLVPGPRPGEQDMPRNQGTAPTCRSPAAGRPAAPST